ncbi:MAG: DnaK suppressor protein [Burkholderiales bacterium]|jgi:DnaK suppressor protein
MKATVTRSAMKSTAAKSANKATAKNAVIPSKTKTTAAKSKAVAKPARPPAKTGVKSTPKPATKAAAKPAPKTAAKAEPAKKVTPAAKSGTVRDSTTKADKTQKVLKQASGSSIAATRSRPTATDAHVSSNNARAGLTDKIEQTEVSKVREVATKTTKPTPVAAEDGTLLTEAEILKMSDKDYMNEAQLAFFKARLQQLERDLLKNAGETTEHLRETVLVPDPADRATIEEEHALELRTRDRERKLLKKVQQSIASIDSGEYGWCEETGEPIGIPRLLARPTATLSLEAQQRRELKQKLYGD